MNLPQKGEYIDIHTHDAMHSEGIFAVENLMAHENLKPETIAAGAFTAGIHPWHLSENNREQLLEYVRNIAGNPKLIAFGEAGFDKLKGPSIELQKSTFAEQVRIAGENQKPLVIHCVRSWDELLAAHKDLKPITPWLVHGFRGKKELALQLIKRGMYLSFWFDFVLRPESAELLRFLPKERIFLETDGADVDIREIYRKVSDDLEIPIDVLKERIRNNFNLLFNNSNTR
jgi:TatD DNase family protein